MYSGNTCNFVFVIASSIRSHILQLFACFTLESVVGLPLATEWHVDCHTGNRGGGEFYDTKSDRHVIILPYLLVP